MKGRTTHAMPSSGSYKRMRHEEEDANTQLIIKALTQVLENQLKLLSLPEPKTKGVQEKTRKCIESLKGARR